MKILIICFSFSNKLLADPSVWYRCQSFADRLKVKGIQCDLATESQQEELIENVYKYNKVIFFRPRQSKDFINLIRKIDSLKIQRYASYDDLIFDPSTYIESSTLKSGAKRSLIASRYRDWANCFEVFDNFIVSTRFLEKKIKEINKKANVNKIENIIPIHLERDTKIWAKNKIERSIGYFGGGMSHKDDILSIKDHLEELTSILDSKIYIPDSIYNSINFQSDKFISYPRLSYKNMFKLCSQMQCCIAPVILDRNSRAKSAIKLTEASFCRSYLIGTYVDSYSEYSNFNTFIPVEENGNYSLTIQDFYNQNTLSNSVFDEVINTNKSIFEKDVSEFLEL